MAKGGKAPTTTMEQGHGQVPSPVRICPTGLGENQMSLGSAPAKGQLASCPRTAPPPLLHVCWLHPRVPPSALPSVAEPLFLRINTVKQLSARVTPKKASEPQAISSGPFEPQHRATSSLLNHPLPESSRSTDFRKHWVTGSKQCQCECPDAASLQITAPVSFPVHSSPWAPPHPQ